MRSTTRRALPLLLFALVLNAAPAARGQEHPDLAAVPADAVVFVHVRVGDVWRSDSMRQFREVMAKAGPKALDALDRRFVPSPSTLDRLTLFVLPPTGESREPLPLFVVSTTASMDPAKVARAAIPGAAERTTAGGPYFHDEKTKTGLRFLGDRTLMFGPADAVKAYLERPKTAPKGTLATAVAQAAGKPFTLAVNPRALPPEAFREVPPPIAPLLKADYVLLSVDLKKEATVNLRLQYADASAVAEAEQSVQGLVQMARQGIAQARKEIEPRIYGEPNRKDPSPLEELPEAAVAVFALGMIQQAEEFLGALPLKKDGNALAMTFTVPEGPLASGVAMASISAGLLLPAVQKVREAASRAKSQNNLKQIGLAMHNHESAHNRLPAAAICDKNGKPLLSWRVAILPYIEQDNLYRQFKLDEPWDSENNKRLIPMMPVTYVSPRFPNPKPGETVYQVFTGKDAMFDLVKGRSIVSIPDGTSNTIMAVEASESVIWTKPEDIPHDPNKPLPKLGAAYGGIVNVLFGDGSVRTLNLNNLPEKTLRLAIMPADGQPFNLDDSSPQPFAEVERKVKPADREVPTEEKKRP